MPDKVPPAPTEVAGSPEPASALDKASLPVSEVSEADKHAEVVESAKLLDDAVEKGSERKRFRRLLLEGEPSDDSDGSEVEDATPERVEAKLCGTIADETDDTF